MILGFIPSPKIWFGAYGLAKIDQDQIISRTGEYIH